VANRGSLLIASILLFTCLLFGQSSPSQPGSVYGMYVSGYEIPNGEKYGKDLGDYPSQILSKVRGKWYPRIPELQKSPGFRTGTVVIEFEIGRDGTLVKTNTIASAGDRSMDAAASEAISSSAPFGNLPVIYSEKKLAVRMHFGYKQSASAEAPACDGPNWGAHPASGVVLQVGNGVTPPQATYSPDPEYSLEARQAKYQSVATVAGTVEPHGTFTDLCIARAAGFGLDEKAIETVKTWKFEPALLQDQPVAVRILVEVNFRLY
jgi:TonB family protein